MIENLSFGVAEYLSLSFFLPIEPGTCTTRTAHRSSRANGANPTTRTSLGQNGWWCLLENKTKKTWKFIFIIISTFFSFHWATKEKLSSSTIYSKKQKKERGKIKEMMLYKYEQNHIDTTGERRGGKKTLDKADWLKWRGEAKKGFVRLQAKKKEVKGEHCYMARGNIRGRCP